MNLSHMKDRLGFFKELYRESLDKYEPTLSTFDRHLAQYKGSKQLDGASEAALVVRNVTYELIESQVSTLIPTPTVEARHYTEGNDRGAKAIERLCATLRNELPFEKMNDLDERYTYIYGGSVWLAEWDSTLGHGKEKGGVRVLCLPPTDFIPEPGVYEVEDMAYCFLRFRGGFWAMAWFGAAVLGRWRAGERVSSITSGAGRLLRTGWLAALAGRGAWACIAEAVARLRPSRFVGLSKVMPGPPTTSSLQGSRTGRLPSRRAGFGGTSSNICSSSLRTLWASLRPPT